MMKAENTNKWKSLFELGGPRNFYPHSYVVSWYFKRIRPKMQGASRKAVLDIGCGTAPDVFLFACEGYDYYGIDVTDKCYGEILKACNERKLNCEKIHLNLFAPPQLPFSAESFEVVIGLESIHFNITPADMQSMVDEVNRVLVPGGGFFFTTVNRKHYFAVTEHSEFVTDTCLRIREGFEEKERAGLEYHVFSGPEEIRNYFQNFAEVNIGEYYLDMCDEKPDAYYVIFGVK